MAAGFVKLRRGLLEHLPRMTPNAAKLYLFLLLKAKAVGVDQGVYRTTSRRIEDDLAMGRESIIRATRELENMTPKPFIEVKRSRSRHSLTEYKILRFTGAESQPVNSDSTGTECLPVSRPVSRPVNHPKQLAINGLASPNTEETYKNTNGAEFQQGSEGSYPDWFARFWSLYPSVKGAKKAAFEKAMKAVKTPGDIELALDYLGIRAKHHAAMRASGAWVGALPHVERYFGKGLWSQEPEIPADGENNFRRSWE